MDLPLVSCIMPTCNRLAFVRRALDAFLRQDYRNAELVVVDSGSIPVDGIVADVPGVRYIRLDRRPSIGAVRNVACEAARGELVVHWDDDDWHAAHRVRYQVSELLRADADVCGIDRVVFFDCRDLTAWLYSYPASARFWIHGSSLCYRRTFWQAGPFADIDNGEDTRFIWNATGRMHALADHEFHVSMIHGDNVSITRAGGRYWRPLPASTIRTLLGPDFPSYVIRARPQQQLACGR